MAPPRRRLTGLQEDNRRERPPDIGGAPCPHIASGPRPPGWLMTRRYALGSPTAAGSSWTGRTRATLGRTGLSGPEPRDAPTVADRRLIGTRTASSSGPIMPARPSTRHRHSPAHLPSDPGGGQSRPRQGESQRRRTAQKEELDVGTQLSLETVRSQYRHMRFRRPGSPCEGRQRRVIPRSQPPSSAFARAARAASPISAIRIEGRDFHSTPAAFGRCESSPAPACTPVSGITDRGMCSRRRFHSGLPCAAIQRASSSRASPGGMTRCQIVSVWPATSTAFARVLTRQLVCCPPFFRSGSLASVL